jgi:hypothetical protein
VPPGRGIGGDLGQGGQTAALVAGAARLPGRRSGARGLWSAAASLRILEEVGIEFRDQEALADWLYLEIASSYFQLKIDEFRISL